MLAEAHTHLGQIEPAWDTLTAAFADGQEKGECWWEAELHRLKGELLLSPSMDHQLEAEASFHHAPRVARRQHTASLELRATTSLSRLWQQQQRHPEAHELLAAVYNTCTEGFDTADLQEARELLAVLQA